MTPNVGGIKPSESVQKTPSENLHPKSPEPHDELLYRMNQGDVLFVKIADLPKNFHCPKAYSDIFRAFYHYYGCDPETLIYFRDIQRSIEVKFKHHIRPENSCKDYTSSLRFKMDRESFVTISKQLENYGWKEDIEERPFQ